MCGDLYSAEKHKYCPQIVAKYVSIFSLVFYALMKKTLIYLVFCLFWCAYNQCIFKKT